MKSFPFNALGAAASLIFAGFCVATPASAGIVTFTFSGLVAPGFIDNDNVYGFGAGADLSGDSVTDVYTVDTSTLAFTSGGIPGDAGSVYNEYGPGGFSGADFASSTINGHTVTIGPSNGYTLVAYIQQLYAPNPLDQGILLLQAIGAETTGTAIGSEFLIRDEVVSYSAAFLPLPLTSGFTLSPAALAAAGNGEWSGVFFPYAPGATAGFFGAVVPGGFLTPEPAAWTLMLAGFGAMGFAIRSRRRKQ
jgi:PEP-CTERM motif